MVDFKKLGPEREEKYEYLYRCSECKTMDWYWIELPEHLLFCSEPGYSYRCRGRLVLVDTRPRAR